MFLLIVVLPGQIHVTYPKSLAQIHYPRLYKKHIHNINQITDIIGGHPYCPVPLILIRERAPQRYHPGVIQHGQSRQRHPHHVRLSIRIDGFITVNIADHLDETFRFCCGWIFDYRFLFHKTGQEGGFGRKRRLFERLSAAYGGGSRGSFYSLAGGLGP